MRALRTLAALLRPVVALLAFACSSDPATNATQQAAPRQEAVTAQPALVAEVVPPSASEATAPAMPSRDPAAWAAIPAIVDPANFGWPRAVKDISGTVVEIKEKPQRIVTLSLGFEEITLALVPVERVAGITPYASEVYSNVADLADQVPTKISGDPETVLAAHPDLVIAYHFTEPEVIKHLRDAGVTVVQVEGGETTLDPQSGYVNQVLLLSYLYGEEESGLLLAARIKARLDKVHQVLRTALKDHPAPRVLYYGGGWSPGIDTNVDWIIRTAGGVNAAADTGISGWKEVGVESVLQMHPDFLVYSADYPGTEDLLANPAMADTPIVRDGRIVGIPDRYMTTLSHWNVRGVEELAKALWPDSFAGVDFESFP